METTMIHQALYRVWRPGSFDEMVGQEHIRRTLENAITQDRISHAYLFAGPRGTGKTSTARILAKAINCADRQGAIPCGQCASCINIASGNSLDVLELDAASNRGIDDIRDLREKVSFLPALGRYRMFILDEAHMLTAAACDALLKTLEEPPEHVVFVLATTDPGKLPETVQSRCQRFDFRKLPQAAMESRLIEIVASIGRTAESEALSLIIRQADGSLRDAISMLDQCLSYSMDILTGEEACDILGFTRLESLSTLFDAVMSGDAPALFQELERLFAEGSDPAVLLKEYAGYCRDLLLLSLCGKDTELVMASGDQRQRMILHSEAYNPDQFRQMVSRLEETAGEKSRGNIRYMAEALFAGLLLRMGQGQLASQAGITNTQGLDGDGFAVSQILDDDDLAVLQGSKSIAVPQSFQLSDRSDQSDLGDTDRQIWQGATIQQTNQGVPDLQAKQDTTTISSGGESTVNRPEEALSADNAPVDPIPTGSLMGSLPSAQWKQILERVKAQKVILQAYLYASLKQDYDQGKLTIYFDSLKGRFHKERSQEPENAGLLKEIAGELLGQDLEIVYTYVNEDGPQMDPVDKAIALFGRDVVKLE